MSSRAVGKKIVEALAQGLSNDGPIGLNQASRWCEELDSRLEAVSDEDDSEELVDAVADLVRAVDADSSYDLSRIREMLRGRDRLVGHGLR